MIKIILLKDAVATKGFVFCKVVVESNGFELPVCTGMLAKPKALVASVGTVAMELPDVYLGKVQAVTTTFQVEGSDELKEYTTLQIAH